ncbi:MAG: MMPL family transporter, partial [bacterium]|nr:MMPL family transporter [bacterium]
MFEKIAPKILRIFFKHPFSVLFLVALLVAVAVPGTLRLFKNIQTDLTALLPDDYRSVALIQTVREKTKGIGSQTIVLEGKNREAMIRLVKDLAEYLEKESIIREVMFEKPAYDFLSEHKLLYVGLEDLEEIRDRIDRRIQREKLGSLYISFDEEEEGDGKIGFDDLEKEYGEKYSQSRRSRYYESDEGDIFVLQVYPTGNSADLGFVKKLTTLVEQKVAAFDVKRYDPSIEYFFAGSFQSKVNEYNSLVKDLKRAGLIALVGVVILLYFRFRSFISVGILWLPLLSGLSWTFSLTYLTIGDLNVVTSFLFSILTGLGIEFGIHLFSRYLEEKANGKSVEQAMEEMFLRVGRASLTSAATAGIPFILLGLNDFKGFSEFGMITGVGIFVTLLAYLLILPPVIIILERWGWLHIQYRHKESRQGGEYPKARIIFWTTAVLSIACIFLIPRLEFEYDFGKLRAKIPGYDLVNERYWKAVPHKSNPSVVIVNSDEEAHLVKETLLKKKETLKDPILHHVQILSDLAPKQQEEKIAVLKETEQLMEDPLIEKKVKGERKEDIDEFKESLRTKPFTMQEVPDKLKDVFLGDESVPGQMVFIFGDPAVELQNGRHALQFRNEIA